MKLGSQSHARPAKKALANLDHSTNVQAAIQAERRAEVHNLL